MTSEDCGFLFLLNIHPGNWSVGYGNGTVDAQDAIEDTVHHHLLRCEYMHDDSGHYHDRNDGTAKMISVSNQMFLYLVVQNMYERRAEVTSILEKATGKSWKEIVEIWCKTHKA